MMTVILLPLWGPVTVEGDVLSLPIEVVVSIGKEEHIHNIKLGQLTLGGGGGGILHYSLYMWIYCNHVKV